MGTRISFRRLVTSLLAVLLGLWLVQPAQAQIPFGLGKGKKEEPAKKSDKPPTYTEKDKAKLAEIAQRPDVKEKIDAAVDQLRRQHMEQAFGVNTADERDESVRHGLVPPLLYDNPILQDFVNGVGQRLVPKDSENLYAFKILFDPVPRAESLTTGTVYVSTGLIAMIDNEAQLAYILGHEIAHVEKNHHTEAIRNGIVEAELIEDKEKAAARNRMIFGMAMAGAGAAIGGAAGGVDAAIAGAAVGGLGGYLIGQFLFRNKLVPTEWSALQENEADEMGLKLAVATGYDIRQVPPLYAMLEDQVKHDSRVGLGFMGNARRVRERTQNIKSLLEGPLKADIAAREQQGALIGSTPNFSVLIAALKRDNGIVAMLYDLFPLAKRNLEDAIALRSNDPRTHVWLGRCYRLIGRTEEEKQEAVKHFLQAIKLDSQRNSYPDPHLQYALAMIDRNNPSDYAEIQGQLKTYVTVYQRDNGGQVPRNMDVIYDYFLLTGENAWYAPPVDHISTKLVDAFAHVMVTQPSTQATSTSAAPKPAAARRPGTGAK